MSHPNTSPLYKAPTPSPLDAPVPVEGAGRPAPVAARADRRPGALPPGAAFAGGLAWAPEAAAATAPMDPSATCAMPKWLVEIQRQAAQDYLSLVDLHMAVVHEVSEAFHRCAHDPTSKSPNGMAHLSRHYDHDSMPLSWIRTASRHPCVSTDTQIQLQLRLINTGRVTMREAMDICVHELHRQQLFAYYQFLERQETQINLSDSQAITMNPKHGPASSTHALKAPRAANAAAFSTGSSTGSSTDFDPASGHADAVPTTLTAAQALKKLFSVRHWTANDVVIQGAILSGVSAAALFMPGTAFLAGAAAAQVVLNHMVISGLHPVRATWGARAIFFGGIAVAAISAGAAVAAVLSYVQGA